MIYPVGIIMFHYNPLALKYRYMDEVYYLSTSTEEVMDALVMCV